MVANWNTVVVVERFGLVMTLNRYLSSWDLSSEPRPPLFSNQEVRRRSTSCSSRVTLELIWKVPALLSATKFSHPRGSSPLHSTSNAAREQLHGRESLADARSQRGTSRVGPSITHVRCASCRPDTSDEVRITTTITPTNQRFRPGTSLLESEGPFQGGCSKSDIHPPYGLLVLQSWYRRRRARH
jgi:hypothetical protein